MPLRPHTIGDRPRPHIVTTLVRLRELRALADRLAEDLGGAHLAIESLDGVHQADFDLLITDRLPLRAQTDAFTALATAVVGDAPRVDVKAALRSVVFYGPTRRTIAPDTSTQRHVIDGVRSVAPSTSARDLMRASIQETMTPIDECGDWSLVVDRPASSPRTWSVPSGDETLKRLVRETIDPAASAQPRNVTLPGLLESNAELNEWDGLVDDTSGRTLVAHFRRPTLVGPDGNYRYGKECLLVPAWIQHPERWVEWAIERWAETYEMFRPDRQWHRSPAWMTADELNAAATLQAADDARAAAVAEHDALVAAAAAALDKTRGAAWSLQRRLLTSDGETLEGAVADAFERLGFAVQRMDGDRDSYKVEDLRVTDPAVPGWEAIVEVKGTRKGASRDFVDQINSAALQYVKATGQEPAARWLIVNAEREKAPGDRQQLYASEAAKVAHFGAAEHGLVVDTRLIFTLLRTPAAEHVDLRVWLRGLSGLAPLEAPCAWT